MTDIYVVQSSINDIDRFEHGVLWRDMVALINGRIYALTEALLHPDKTPDLLTVRQVQGAREELVKFSDLLDMLREEIERRDAEKEEEDGTSNASDNK